MKLGKVLINLSYVVDLDNEEMVKQAKQFLCEDMSNLVKYEDIYSWVATVEDSSLSERDIPSFLLEEEK
jgi:TusA-related sulfurtransferase